MNDLPERKKKKNIYPFLGVITLVLGVLITVTASQQSTEQRRFAQTPITYPNTYPTGTPTPPIFELPQDKWSTKYVRLGAKNFYIRIGNKYFYGNNTARVHTDPGLDLQTLEVEWFEHNVEMRLFAYFRKKSPNMWEIYDLRTYNGNAQGDWIFYQIPTTSSVESLVGQYNYMDQRRFIPTSTVDAEIVCDGCLIEAFMQPELLKLSSGFTLDLRLGIEKNDILRLPYFSGYYGIAAVLRDASGTIITDKSMYRYEWNSDNTAVATAIENNFDVVNISTRGEITSYNFGFANITVKAIRKSDNQLVAVSTFPVYVAESLNHLNINTPSCTLAMYKDNVANNPPSYVLQTKTTTVSPGEQVVLATNFVNNTYKQYEQAKFHIALGDYFQFVDSNGSACSYNTQAKTVVCDHGMFLHTGATSMAFRVKYIGSQAAPATVFGTTFASNGDTGSCSTTVNAIPVLNP